MSGFGSSGADRSPRLRPADFLAHQRGGGLWSEAVDQRLAARVATLAHRAGASPAQLTVANLVLGLGVSVLVALAAESEPFWPIGLIALVGWQLAYVLDCADGQLARATDRTSHSGARLDVFCDFAVQAGLLTAISVVASATTSIHAGWIAAFASTWSISLFTSVLQGSDTDRSHSLIRSQSLAVRVLKLSRDYGMLVTVIGVLLVVDPRTMAAVVIAGTVLNVLFIAASIVKELSVGSQRR